MSEEQIEKPVEKYFYVDKEKTYNALTSIATSFIGAGLALLLFTNCGKPPVQPCSCPCGQPVPYISHPCPMMRGEAPRPPKCHKYNKDKRQDIKRDNEVPGHGEHMKKQRPPRADEHPNKEHKAPKK